MSPYYRKSFSFSLTLFCSALRIMKYFIPSRMPLAANTEPVGRR